MTHELYCDMCPVVGQNCYCYIERLWNISVAFIWRKVGLAIFRKTRLGHQSLRLAKKILKVTSDSRASCLNIAKVPLHCIRPGIFLPFTMHLWTHHSCHAYPAFIWHSGRAYPQKHECNFYLNARFTVFSAMSATKAKQYLPSQTVSLCSVFRLCFQFWIGTLPQSGDPGYHMYSLRRSEPRYIHNPAGSVCEQMWTSLNCPKPHFSFLLPIIVRCSA